MGYLINVERKFSEGVGTLTYQSEGVSVNTTCWFEIDNPIPAKTYTMCSATHMNKKKNSKGQKREGIFIPNQQTGRTEIFIHMGKNQGWSDGCIVILEEEMLKIWNSIKPKNHKNVTIVVKNV